MRQRAYAGTHFVNAHNGPIEREVPAIVKPELYEQALPRLEENKRYSDGRRGRQNLLRGLVWCVHCGTAYAGDSSSSSMGSYYHYYACRTKRTRTYDKRLKGLTCPRVRAGWLEELVWADVRSILGNPGEVLQRVREQLADGEEDEDLQGRHASLTRRLAAKQEKSRYVKLYAQGHMDEEELEVYMTDLRNQVENLKVLLASVETELAAKQENKMVAQSAEVWLMTLRKNLARVEVGTEEAFGTRREL